MAIYANQTVVGVFDERGLADRAVGDLENAGFSADQIHYSGPGQNPGRGEEALAILRANGAHK